MHVFRKNKLPTIPKSLVKSKRQLFNLRCILKINTVEYFCHMKEISSIFVFTCSTNLDILSHTTHIFADGAFFIFNKIL